MEHAHLQQLIELENSYWWHVSKRELATNLLQSVAAPGARIVEGGIGGAGNLLRWQQLGYEVAGLDVMPASVEYAKRLGLSSVFQHDLHNRWPIEENSVRAVVLLDVLEHLEDPVKVLQHASKILSAAGQIIFTVPAYPSLFSEWDFRLGHFRRYTMRMMQQHAHDAGLHLKTIRHWNAVTLPAAYAIRKYRSWKKITQTSEFPKVKPWLNSCLRILLRIEHFVGNRLGLPCGLSLAGVLQK